MAKIQLQNKVGDKKTKNKIESDRRRDRLNGTTGDWCRRDLMTNDSGIMIVLLSGLQIIFTSKIQ